MKDKNGIEIKIGDTINHKDCQFSGEVITMYELTGTVVVKSDGDEYEVDAEDCIVEIPFKTKVLIIVSGGNVQEVVSNDPDMEYVIVDYDNIECEDEENTGLHVSGGADQTFENMYEAIHPEDEKYEKMVYDHLKEINF